MTFAWAGRQLKVHSNTKMQHWYSNLAGVRCMCISASHAVTLHSDTDDRFQETMKVSVTVKESDLPQTQGQAGPAS